MSVGPCGEIILNHIRCFFTVGNVGVSVTMTEHGGESVFIMRSVEPRGGKKDETVMFSKYMAVCLQLLYLFFGSVVVCLLY